MFNWIIYHHWISRFDWILFVCL